MGGDAPRLLKLLVVGINYAPEEIGIGPYTAGLCEALSARGHAVGVVAARPYYPEWKQLPGVAGSGWAWSRAQLAGVRVTWCPHYVPAKPDALRRLIHHASFAVTAAGPALAAARRIKPDVVIAVAPALLSAPVALAAARLAGAPCWLHVQDLEIEAALATGLLPQGSRIARAAAGVETAILSRMAAISTISPQMRQRIEAKVEGRVPVHEVRNWANHLEAFAGSDGASLRREWALGDRKVALYAGNIANKQGIEILVDAARQLAGRKDLVFVICGEGPNRAALERRAQGLSNILFRPLQPASRVGDLLSLAHVHLLPQLAGAAELVLPSKLTNMLASGRPVVATAAPGTALAEEVAGCGLITPPGDAVALADAVARLADDTDLAARLGSEAARRALHRWSRDAVIDSLESRLRALAGQER